MVLWLRSECSTLMMEDGTVGRSLQDVLWDLNLVERMAPDAPVEL